MFNLENQPTHIARVISRLKIIGFNESGDTFLAISYVVESVIKTIAIALCATLRKTSANNAYKFEYDLIHSDSLGVWESAISTISSHAYAGFASQDVQPVIAWLNKKRTKADDQWTRDAIKDCQKIFEALGITENEPPRMPTAKYLLSQLVQIRNKTKAHGAVGPDFFRKANQYFLNATRLLVENLPMQSWDWIYLSIKSPENIHFVRIVGLDPKYVSTPDTDLGYVEKSGIYFRAHSCGSYFYCDPLIITNEECSSFLLPNGSFNEKGSAEYIDYYNAETKVLDVTEYLVPPAPLPPSATEGIPALEIFSNVFGNLPPYSQDYVERNKLQDELITRIRDKNHSIVTLHGRGGIGKTSLALFVAHKLSNDENTEFEYIIWLSARDLELKTSGPSEVRRAVANLDEICKVVGSLFGKKIGLDEFSKILQNPSCIDSKGLLFIFDNFETLDEPKGIHKFLDTHTHIPNKIVITSRERAFKGDYPIEVGGMEYEEAKQLIRGQSKSLGIEGIITNEKLDDIYEYTDGHAYIIRVLLGEIAKESCWIPLKSLVPRRIDLLNAVFERSFNRLSLSGRTVFLTIGNWRAIIPELSILTVLGMRDIDVEAGIEECWRLSLISRQELADGQFCYSTPELAHIFAKKKLEGDPDRLIIQEDLELLKQFGQIKADEIAGKQIDEIVYKFLRKSFEIAQHGDQKKREKIEVAMIRAAELWPKGWLLIAEYRKRSQKSSVEISYAYRRAVEEMPSNLEAWLARAKYAEEIRDQTTRIASLVSAVEANPQEVALAKEVAFQVMRYVDDYKDHIPISRRGVYLASIRGIMEKLVEKLDSNGLSRLAWLFLLEGNEKEAWKYANLGLERDPKHSHCLKIVEKLRGTQHK
jgi:tetratricopeptide (TPR) repeat protein